MTGIATIIAIDGPAGSGKSSVSCELGKRLKMTYLDTGAIYRSIALEALRQDIQPNEVTKLIELTNNTKIAFENTKKGQKVLVNGQDVTTEIRSEKISQLTSVISAHPTVRGELHFLQRSLGYGAKRGAVVEGRDIGTVVFPNADLKIFLNASEEERAYRRAAQLGKSGDRDKKTILADIIERDKRDTTRKVAPLMPAHGAIVIDTTSMSFDKVADLIEDYIVEAVKQADG